MNKTHEDIVSPDDETLNGAVATSKTGGIGPSALPAESWLGSAPETATASGDAGEAESAGRMPGTAAPNGDRFARRSFAQAQRLVPLQALPNPLPWQIQEVADGP